MARPVFHLHPQARRQLADLGARIALARERRSMTRKLLAQRAGITEFTLRRVESGEIGVTFGAYLAVLYALGLAADLEAVAAADPLGRDLQDAALLQRPRRVGKRSAKAQTPDTGTAIPPSPATPPSSSSGQGDSLGQTDDRLPGITSSEMVDYLRKRQTK